MALSLETRRRRRRRKNRWTRKDRRKAIAWRNWCDKHVRIEPLGAFIPMPAEGFSIVGSAAFGPVNEPKSVHSLEALEQCGVILTARHCGAFFNERFEIEAKDGVIREYRVTKGGLCWLPGNHEGPHDWEHLPLTRKLVTEATIIEHTGNGEG